MTIWAGDATIGMSSLPAVLEPERNHITQPLAPMGVAKPIQAHLFSLPTTHAAAAKVDAVLGTMIAKVGLHYKHIQAGRMEMTSLDDLIDLVLVNTMHAPLLRCRYRATADAGRQDERLAG